MIRFKLFPIVITVGCIAQIFASPAQADEAASTQSQTSDSQATVSQESSSQTINSRTQILKEPAYVTPTRLGPMPDAGSHRITEVQIIKEAKPVFERRLNMLLEQINLAETKGWITNAEANNFRADHSGIITLANSIKDPINQDRKTVDEVEGKITALNAALYAASNKKSTDTPAAPHESNKQENAGTTDSTPDGTKE